MTGCHLHDNMSSLSIATSFITDQSWAELRLLKEQRWDDRTFWLFAICHLMDSDWMLNRSSWREKHMVGDLINGEQD